ncbi:ROK family transcriptional regulator [Sediminibacillus albus]|uniref:ROK family protein (Putative glucokinase) n=1 Tax=Sediminibacillus albus TaxID=407036 RepID=A0A1G9A4T8_9BACI|nr:ROK family transcriptional regulator [Sediminibacillus albus]SDK22343.1 ROK family protein (putative glucokinase) [Sediminibacillus albus]
MKKTSTRSNADIMKKQNRTVVMHELRKHGPVSKADLAERTELSFMSISNIVQELLAADIIEESGMGASLGGRKPALYRLSTKNQVISVDINVDNIQAAKINIRGEVIDTVSKSIHNQEEQASITDHVHLLVDQLLGSCKERTKGIGVSSPGPVDSQQGMILTPPNLKEIGHLKIAEQLESRHRLPVVVERDANAAALGEHWFGSSQKKDSMLYVLADQGIGGGLIVQGEIYRGFLNGAGEIGHHTIDMNGPKCSCGSYGCLETFASGIALIKKAEIEKQRLTSKVSSSIDREQEIKLEAIFTAANQGDALAKQLLEEAANYLGVGIANAANILNPEEIIIGGAIMHGYPLGLETITHIVNNRSLYDKHNKTIIKRSQFKEDAQLIGAAAAIIDHLFMHPDKLLSAR